MNVSETMAQPLILILILTMGFPAPAQRVTTSQYGNGQRCQPTRNYP